MTPPELLASCMERIDSWNAGEQFCDEPTIALTLQRPRPPGGDSVRLYGRSGPRGRLANCRPKGDGWQIVAYFPAVAIARDVAEFLGEKVDLTLAPRVAPKERRIVR